MIPRKIAIAAYAFMSGYGFVSFVAVIFGYRPDYATVAIVAFMSLTGVGIILADRELEKSLDSDSDL